MEYKGMHAIIALREAKQNTLLRLFRKFWKIFLFASSLDRCEKHDFHSIPSCLEKQLIVTWTKDTGKCIELQRFTSFPDMEWQFRNSAKRCMSDKSVTYAYMKVGTKIISFCQISNDACSRKRPPVPWTPSQFQPLHLVKQLHLCFSVTSFEGSS